jgi:coproporphyrinogen III oxidase
VTSTGGPPSSHVSARAADYFRGLQERICAALEQLDGRSRFREDAWEHTTGGGGRTRILEHGRVFEKAGVNYSSTSSMLTESLASRLGVAPQGATASGVSLVLHPLNPMVPTVHMNVRHIGLTGGDAWFGGGMDLTPYYLREEDAVHFHRTLKGSCDRHDPSYYPEFKRWCDEYFFLKHRGEARGIGGIFFDDLRDRPEETFAFVRDVGDTFLAAYVPIAERRLSDRWTDAEKAWQLIRRGRYVEFNLLYDRGTLFGLETKGRAESILMSLPPEVRWTYNVSPPAGTPEAALMAILSHPKEWT